MKKEDIYHVSIGLIAEAIIFLWFPHWIFFPPRTTKQAFVGGLIAEAIVLPAPLENT